MTGNSGYNYHKGLIRSIDDGSIEIGVIPPVACSSCELSSSCEISNDEEKLITVNSVDDLYNVGDEVQLIYTDKLSTKAMLIVYIMPLLVLLSALLITRMFSSSELIIGLVMLASLPLYFLLFKVFAKKINKEFAFKIQSKERGRDFV